MEIGIIGVGNIGLTLARHFRSKGHAVKIANSRGPETLKDIAAQSQLEAVTRHEAAMARDVVVISVPASSIPKLPDDLFDNTPETATVIDTGNYYPAVRDGRLEEIDAGEVESVWVSRRIGRPVVKVFNSIGAKSLAVKPRPEDADDRICLPVSGDGAEDKKKVMDLLNQIGFDAFDVGPLKESWRQQPGTPCYLHDFDALMLEAAIAAANPLRIDSYREQADEFAAQLIAVFGGRRAAGASQKS